MARGVWICEVGPAARLVGEEVKGVQTLYSGDPADQGVGSSNCNPTKA